MGAIIAAIINATIATMMDAERRRQPVLEVGSYLKWTTFMNKLFIAMAVLLNTAAYARTVVKSKPILPRYPYSR